LFFGHFLLRTTLSFIFDDWVCCCVRHVSSFTHIRTQLPSRIGSPVGCQSSRQCHHAVIGHASQHRSHIWLVAHRRYRPVGVLLGQMGYARIQENEREDRPFFFSLLPFFFWFSVCIWFVNCLLVSVFCFVWQHLVLCLQSRPSDGLLIALLRSTLSHSVYDMQVLLASRGWMRRPTLVHSTALPHSSALYRYPPSLVSCGVGICW
jgi:hypothetical protein